LLEKSVKKMLSVGFRNTKILFKYHNINTLTILLTLYLYEGIYKKYA